MHALAPWADLLYACDHGWWERYAPAFGGMKVTQDPRVASIRDDVHRVPCDPDGTGLSRDPHRIHGGGNGGYQAVNLAVLLGAARIILLGFDMSAGPDGRRHAYPDHQPGLNNPDESNFMNWRTAFAALARDLRAAGIPVVNCSTRTALDCFPRGTLETVL